MADVLTKEQRSYNMSRIKSRDTKLETKLRRLLYRIGLKGFRVTYKLLGKPDITYPKYKLAIFVDGCFWHKCPKCFIKPETRADFWMKKIDSNKQRDKVINEKLTGAGWIVLRFWEHQLKKEPDKILSLIKSKLNHSSESKS